MRSPSRGPLVMLLALLASCGGDPSPATPGSTLVLVPPDPTLHRRTALTSYLENHELAWLVDEDSTLPPGDVRPPFSVYDIRVPGLQYNGHPGTARYRFLNGALMEAFFYPRDQLLRSELGPANDSAEGPQRGIKVGDEVDGSGRTYRVWRVVAVFTRAQAWLREYS